MQDLLNFRGAVRPYIYARLDTIALIHDAFKATESERLEATNGLHIEASIGDSMIVLEAADPPVSVGTTSSIYVYVPDVDLAFRRALEPGPLGQRTGRQAIPYQERGAGVRDAYGNTWWIASYIG